MHDRARVDLSQEPCGSRLILRHNALGVVRAVAGNMRHRLIDPIDDLD